MLNIVGHKKIYLTISGVFVAGALLAIILFGFRQGIDFVGGTLWQFRIADERPAAQEIENIFKNDFNIAQVLASYDEENNIFFVRISETNEEDHQKFLGRLKEKFQSFEELSFQSIGPSVGGELRSNAVWAIILVLLGISFYIAFAFRRASKPVSSWRYGFITLLTLFHDVVIPAGLFASLGRLGRVEIDTNFIVALLVVVGFSVHDTIVVFDRIRENLIVNTGKKQFGDIVNESVNQTMARSINTSMTLVLILVVLLFFGPLNLHYFVLTLLVGVLTGTYSSIFIASPGLVISKGKS